MKELRSIVSGFQFLTIIPLKIDTDFEDLKNSLKYFPLVGLVIALIIFYSYQILGKYLDSGVSATITILIYAVLTRGLHLDGLMDTIDGFFSYRKRERILEIMKDPTVGSFAVIGALIWGLIFFSTLPLLGLAKIVTIFTLSRYNILMMPLLFSYPRESGTGKFFVENICLKKFIFSSIITIVSISIFNLSYLIYLPISLLISYLIGVWSKKMINGITGDVLGFTNEFTTMVLMVLLSAY
ncbi:MAG: adenosylcobinamide-GDP ribazoletransferase [Candidatus Cloacimonadota bacterium]|nr:MAG: adenosylcobinamide-GDP ribazoletransferase [Candidatus Cloacimonadota bacterium]PIE77880.1 MAG: adenosylcobinamide-GDP ribazoletransferase [Candidatus Delongbacteria bacterium]